MKAFCYDLSDREDYTTGDRSNHFAMLDMGRVLKSSTYKSLFPSMFGEKEIQLYNSVIPGFLLKLLVGEGIPIDDVARKIDQKYIRLTKKDLIDIFKLPLVKLSNDYVLVINQYYFKVYSKEESTSEKLVIENKNLGDFINRVELDLFEDSLKVRFNSDITYISFKKAIEKENSDILDAIKRHGGCLPKIYKLCSKFITIGRNEEFYIDFNSYCVVYIYKHPKNVEDILVHIPAHLFEVLEYDRKISEENLKLKSFRVQKEYDYSICNNENIPLTGTGTGTGYLSCKWTYEEEKEEVMNTSNVERVLKGAVETNKEAAKDVAFIKVGQAANKAAKEVITNSIPRKYKKVAENPLFDLAVANIFAAAIDYTSKTPNSKKLSKAMITASMLDATNKIDLGAMIAKVMEKVDLSVLGED